MEKGVYVVAVVLALVLVFYMLSSAGGRDSEAPTGEFTYYVSACVDSDGHLPLMEQKYTKGLLFGQRQSTGARDMKPDVCDDGRNRVREGYCKDGRIMQSTWLECDAGFECKNGECVKK